jgi:hypothetical protein
MYGIINQSIQELIIKEFGEETWLKIISKCKLDVAEFQNHETYDDKYTYLLAGAAAEILCIEISAVLKLFGEFWITDISLKKYPALMTSGGITLKEFMRNLPNFHNRIYLSYPKLIAPEFKIIDDENKTIWVEYYSNRPGLTHMMEGMLVGLTKIFNEPFASINLVEEKTMTGKEFDLFSIVWKN